MDNLLDDIRFAWQRMRRRRLVFLVIIITSALSTATAVTVASLLHAALLRPLPLRAADIHLMWQQREPCT
jgi:hypothetical protein